MMTFSCRTAKEILRDPLNLAFGLGFPIVIMLLLAAIQSNIPVSLFEINSMAPGISIFGLSFMTLFSSTLVAKDRESAFLQRLYSTPLKAVDFIMGYMLPILPIAIAQSSVCYLVALILGMDFSVNILYAILLNIPSALFFIALGVLCGSIMNVKQVGGICGALVTNLTAWLSGIWFDLELVGDGFKKVANLLPFAHGVALERMSVIGNFADIMPHILLVLGYAVLFSVLAVFMFLRQMKRL